VTFLHRGRSSPWQPNVSAAGEISPTAAIPLNAPPQIRERVASGRISWTGPLLLVSARPVLLVASQAIVALILFAAHRRTPWRAAGDWWNVYGTVVDVSCLIGLIVGFFWTAQHCALPFVPDWRYLLFRFITFLPGVLLLILFYLRHAVSRRSLSRTGPWTLRQP
jgi:hypothetical protein